MLRTRTYTALALSVTALSLVGCSTPPAPTPGYAHGHGPGYPGMMGGGMMRGDRAIATLTPTQGNNARGMVMFHQLDGQVTVHARVSGLKPNAEHGFHVHENGNCASPDGMSAGGHFNPDAKPHGPQGAAHHAGDMPALKADASGVAEQTFVLTGPTVTEGVASVVGRSVIVHAQPDDYTTQPTGNSGARLGCGVIAAF
jgi:Cu-Zn family superoxide dismutase